MTPPSERSQKRKASDDISSETPSAKRSTDKVEPHPYGTRRRSITVKEEEKFPNDENSSKPAESVEKEQPKRVLRSRK
jgi:hypothetical protein